MDLMDKTIIRKISLAVFSALACGAVNANVARGAAPDPSQVTFGSNLYVDPCWPCKYYPNPSGFFVWAPNNCSSPGQVQRVAIAFIAAATGVPERISASIILHSPTNCPTNKITLSLYTDACYPTGVGTLLASGEATVPAAPCGLAVAKLRNAPALTAGTKYWVAATTSLEQAGLDAEWYSTNSAQLAENLGEGWVEGVGNVVGAIITALTNNPNFTKPDPALVDLQAAAGSLNQAMTMAPGQARDEAVAAQRRAVEQMLEDLVDNLEKTARNDPVKRPTTGFDLKKTTSQTGEAPPIPQNVRLRLTGTSAGTPRFHQ